jgi:hypothetical protein
MIRKIFAAATAASLVIGAAFAGEYADRCTERLIADGRDPSGCSCLEERVLADPALAEEFERIGNIEDPDERYAAGSSAAKAAMDACTRKSG